MDLHVEAQLKEQIVGGDLSKFILLYDDNFADVYRYVYRRFLDKDEAERVTRLVFLDGLSQAKDMPFDGTFRVWMFGLARERVFNIFDRSGFPENQGVIGREEFLVSEDNRSLLERFGKLMEKLGMKEKEILRLKFFEELSDSDVAYVLGEDEGSMSSQILRVLKRVHLLFFGSSGSQDGYYAELSGEMSKVRAMELIEVPEVFKLNLRADLSSRIARQDFAIEVESESEELPADPFEEATGSDDPAKIFVEAVNEMREEELRREERGQWLSDLFDRFGWLLMLVPLVIFLWLLSLVFFQIFDFSPTISRGYPTICSDVEFDGEFNDSQRREINVGVSDRICERFDADKLVVSKNSRSDVNVSVETGENLLHYNFRRPVKRWKVYEYEKKPVRR